MELNYKTYGEGPALIILHGLFGSLDNWQTLARRFSDTWSVYIIDQRNHGKSPHSEEHDYQLMSADLEEFMDSQGIIQAHLIGHSMGGKTVMQFAADHTQRVDRMIVADMAPIKYEPHHTEILETLNDFPLDGFDSRNDADAWLKERIPEFGVRAFILKNLLRKKDGTFEWKFNLETLSRDYEKILKNVDFTTEIDLPVLFLKGEKSDYIREEYHDQILEYFPRAEFDEIPGAGHWLHAEKPVEFEEKVRQFLQD